MDLSSASLVFFVLPLVLVPLVAWWGWRILPPSIPVAPSAETQDRKRQFLTVYYLFFTVAVFGCCYSIMMAVNDPRPFQMVPIFSAFVMLGLGLALEALKSRHAVRLNLYTDRHFMRHLFFIVALIACMTLACVGFQSSIYWQQSMVFWHFDFEYYGAARITGQRYSDQQEQQDDDDDDGEEADGNEDQQANLWTSVEWMCPSYGTNSGTLCQQELASICDHSSMKYGNEEEQLTYTNFYQVRVYNADDVEEECDANLMDLVNNNNDDDDGYDASTSPQKDGSPYLYIVANCTNGCSAGFTSGRIQSDYKQSRLGLRMGYAFLGLSVVGLLGLVGMTVYRWRRHMSVENNNDAGVELLPSAQGEVT